MAPLGPVPVPGAGPAWERASPPEGETGVGLEASLAWRETAGVREAGSGEGKPRASAACEWLQDEYAQRCL